MPDFTLRGIDDALANRIKEIARVKDWSLNAVMLELLSQAIRISDVTKGKHSEIPGDHQDIALLAGTWASEEAAAFKAALEALERLPAQQ